jgi:hypothetical protein
MSVLRALLLGLWLWQVGGVAAAFDHTHAAWTTLLRKHVVLVDGGRASRVDYTAFAAERKALTAYLDTLTAVTPAEYDGWARAQKLAFLINAYNAFTVEKVLTRYPGLASIRDFGTVFGNPWKDKFFTLLGRAQNLDGIEHGMIRVKGVFDEPRIHFAVNCASIGCPMLREEAYVADRLDAQLEEQTRRFLGDRTRNRLRGGALEVSKIFDWYGDDFKAAAGSVPGYLARYADLLGEDPADRTALRSGRVKLDTLDYDWKLNDTRTR